MFHLPIFRLSRALLTVVFLAAIAALSASLLTPSAQAVVIMDWVTVGNPGNAPDRLYTNNNPDNLLFGSVADTYRIGKHEVTNAQYAEFLSAVAETDTNGLYSANMGSDARGGITQGGVSGSFTYAVRPDMGDKPVNFVSFFDAMRFTNWLENGQPTGLQTAATTEAGVYTIGTGLNETRAAGASFFLPSEDEWYKAAYHQPATAGTDSEDYWLYATGSSTTPTSATASATGDISNPGSNVANYNMGADWNSLNGNVTTVGSAGLLSDSFYGTADQNGNVWEFNEAIISSSSRGLRGGSWDGNSSDLAAAIRDLLVPTFEDSNFGFRIASPFSESAPPSNPLAPEPASGGLLLMGMLLLRGRRQKPRVTAG